WRRVAGQGGLPRLVAHPERGNLFRLALIAPPPLRKGAVQGLKSLL
ncbi:MAG: IS4 family transposase, partial [Thermus sp.]